MYAVLHVSDFYLQAVLRADPTLSRPAPAPAANPAVLTPERGAAATAPSPATHPIQPLLFGTDDFEPREGSASRKKRGSTRASAASASAPTSASAALAVSRPTDHATATAVLAPAPAPAPSAPTPATAAPHVRRGTPPPVALISGDTKKSLVLEANATARAHGVEAGLTAPQAQARCGTIVLRQRSSSAEAEAQHLLLVCALDVSPMVEDTAPGVCTLDLTGLPPEDRSRHVARAVCHLREQGLSATAGIAATPLLARYAAHQTTSVRTVENATAFLHPLPLGVAEPSHDLRHILQSWGIHTLGQFTALPKQEVVRRLGSEGHAFWERARGGDPRPLRPYARNPVFSASLDLEYEVETAEGVLFILQRFVDRLALELRLAGQVAAELVLRLKLADETAHERSFRLPEPTAREDILFRTLHTYLEGLRTAACVVGVSLEVKPTRPLVRQPGLFETGLRDPHGFSETLARVTAIVGSGQLGTPELEDSYRPDALKLVAPLPVIPAPDQPAIWPPLGLPLRRYRPPLSTRVELTSAGQPAFLSGAQLHSPIAALRGPWRSSGDWWKPETWSREEWDIELAVGGLYRLARVKDEWYLDGEYE